MKPIIFSVEDDLNIQNVINIALSNAGFSVFSFMEAKPMFIALKNQTPDLVLLDIMLPGKDGLTIMKEIKAAPALCKIPIVIVSAKSTELDKVIGLDQGADDYIIKPFGVLELVSRVKAVLRRFSKPETNEAITVRGLTLIPDERKCVYEDRTEILTNKEFELLKLLMENHNTITSRDTIIGRVWGYDYVGETRTVDVHIKEIRLKLSRLGIQKGVIQTVRGVGYKLVL